MRDAGSAAPRIRIASAPVAFGIDEVQTDAWRPEPGAILDLMAGLGFEGSELGAPGYFGDPAHTRVLFADRQLELVGAYLPLHFSRSELIDDDLAWLTGMLTVIRDSAPPGSRPKAILADGFGEADRFAFAGRIIDHPETWLPAERFELLVTNLHRAAELCLAAGLDAVVHPHAGTYIEAPHEVRAVADRLDPALVGLCLDTGHIRFGGGDPADIVRDYPTLIRHVHLKDCSAATVEAVTSAGGGLKDALKAGAFCELGTGDAGIDTTVTALLDAGYSGWMVIEQDRYLEGRVDTPDLRDPQARNLRYLQRLGLGVESATRGSDAQGSKAG